MADSCRPVSRHGRYNATGPSSMPYTTDHSAYGNIDYTHTEDMYTVNQPVNEPVERPKTSRGRRRRNRGDIPPRPESRRGRPRSGRPAADPDTEGFGRPASRVGFSPESSYRYSHDEYSRQVSADSPVEEVGRYILQNSPDTSEQTYGRTPPQRELYRQSPQQHNYVSYGDSSYRRDDDGQMYLSRDQMSYTPPQREVYRTSPQNPRPSSSDYINVSPIQRDEAQITTNDLHHSPYTQPFQESPPFRESPYRASPSREHYYNSASPEGHYRPPTGQRPKSARPKTGRKKSARHRQKHQDEQPAQQQYDAASFLTQGDPYGRPSSSLSRYKPLPAIGASTPRGQPESTNVHDESVSHKMEQLTAETQQLALEDETGPASSGVHGSAEDVHGAENRNNNNGSSFAGDSVPDIDVLTHFRQHLSDEIYKKSVENLERGSHIEVGDNADPREGETDGPKVPQPLASPHCLPREPTQDNDRLLLAIKLPDGERHQRYFSPTDSLESVLHFAENMSSADFSEFHLVCNAPKTIFVDLSQQIHETELKDRTVLYLEEKE